MTACWLFPKLDSAACRLKVVLPVFPGDLQLMLHNLRWQRDLDVRKEYGAVLSLDADLAPDHVWELESAAWDTFCDVETFTYPPCPRPGWPMGPNWAFQHTARHMKSSGKPWFWMEADCVPIRADWLDALNHEYCLCRRPIMGVIVPGMGHCNGTAIYPANFCDLSQEAMRCTDVAWDGLMRRETIHLTHDASHLMCHVWGIKNGSARPFGGDPAIFKTWNDVRRWVDLNAVVFHRAKNTTLIDRLRERLV